MTNDAISPASSGLRESSVAFADRSRGLGFAYVMNQLTASLGADRRSRRRVEAVYSALG